MLKRFNKVKERLVTTPLAGHFKLSSKQCSQSLEEEMSRVPYASAVRLLIYDMVYTRPNLAYAISTISRFMLNLSK